MSRPKFSIVIPTRDRPVTLRHSLATALNQTGNDYEVVIADNAGGPAVAAVVEDAAAHTDKIRYSRSDNILSMTENWEKGVSLCSGEYITIIGDDDGMMPSALSNARALIAATGAKILHWHPHRYYWPDHVAHWNSNLLVLNLANTTTHWLSSRSILIGYYSGIYPHDKLASIHNSFVHRDIIQEIIDKHGSYFILPHVPDIVSGVVNLYHTDRFLYCARPMSIGGSSGKSSGMAFLYRNSNQERADAYIKEEKVSLSEFMHPKLIPAQNAFMGCASAKLACKDKLFPDDDDLKVNIHGVVIEMLKSLFICPYSYEETLSDTLALAAKHGITVDPNDIPPKPNLRKTRAVGPLSVSEGQIAGIAIDGYVAGIENIAAATRLAEAMMGRSVLKSW